MIQPIGVVVRRGGLAAALALLIAMLAAAAADAATGPYVSLGDSYTAAPLVPNPTGNPILCGRSTNNYPSDVARALSPSSFTDASCSSATTADMTQSQSLEGGLQTAPPQFNALKSTDAIVTVGIGGNDADLIGYPIRAVVSKRSLKNGGIEIKLRSQKESRIVPMADAVQVAQAHAAEVDKQRTFLSDTLKGLRQAGVLMSAPAGVGVVSGEDVTLNSGGGTLVGRYGANGSGKCDLGRA